MAHKTRNTFELLLDEATKSLLNKDYSNALSTCTKVVNLEPKNIMARIVKAEVLNELRFKESALLELNEAIKLMPEGIQIGIEARIMRPIAYNRGLAEKITVTINPVAYAHLRRGQLLEELNRKGESEEAFKASGLIERKLEDYVKHEITIRLGRLGVIIKSDEKILISQSWFKNLSTNGPQN